MEKIRLFMLKNPSVIQQQELLELFVQAGFSDPADGYSFIADAVNGSLLAVAAFDENTGKLVGFARALGDGVSDCYIQDVTVHREFRRRGIGKKLVEFLLKELEARNIDWVGLIATPGNADFYRSLGFEVLAGYTPMIKRR